MQGRVSANGRVGATAAVYSAAILGELAHLPPAQLTTQSLQTSFLQLRLP